ncbi:hypothetical protein F4677DRAFT_130210 [Hypoxylon crocopeplum]|nr:hypothetical protein F4677DRAFT_130210 [Hypoxylon crocopeplum]
MAMIMAAMNINIIEDLSLVEEQEADKHLHQQHILRPLQYSCRWPRHLHYLRTSTHTCPHDTRTERYAHSISAPYIETKLILPSDFPSSYFYQIIIYLYRHIPSHRHTIPPSWRTVHRLPIIRSQGNNSSTPLVVTPSLTSLVPRLTHRPANPPTENTESTLTLARLTQRNDFMPLESQAASRRHLCHNTSPHGIPSTRLLHLPGVEG